MLGDSHSDSEGSVVLNHARDRPQTEVNPTCISRTPLVHRSDLQSTVYNYMTSPRRGMRSDKALPDDR